MCNIGEGPTFSTESYPKARKPHVCEECGAVIGIGEQYQRVDGIWFGQFQNHKTCMFCAKVRIYAESAFEMGYDEGICFGELWECVGMDYAADCATGPRP